MIVTHYASDERKNEMNELVKLVMQKTGIDENMAEQIVGIVVNHLKAVSYTHLTLPTNREV